MQVKTTFDLFLDKLRPHILDYLESKGFNTKKAIKCLNPKHDDSHPSMLCSSAEEYGWTIHCQACGWTGDIFSVYSILEEKPARGPGWMKEVVLPLASIYNIPAPTIEITPEEQFSYDLNNLYGEIANLLNHDISKMSSAPNAYVVSRKWTEDTLRELDIGTISYNQLTETFDLDQLTRFGLNRPDIFNEENLIFTVRDKFSRPIRFFARRAEGVKPKYSSTTTSELIVDLWRDKGRLYLDYLIDRSIPYIVLVEGQADAVTLWQAGIKNVVALCGNGSFSEAHADSITLGGISRVIVMFDPDKSGQEAVDRLLAKDFVRSGSIQYYIAQLPGTDDPDAFLRKNGVDRLKYVINDLKISAFEYLLSKQNANGDIEKICSDLVPFIASSRSEIARENMARSLSEFFGKRISLGAIMADVRRADETVISATLEQQKSLVKAATRQALDNPVESKEILRDAVEKLDEIDKKGTIGNSARNSCLARVQGTKIVEETSRSGSFKLLPDRLGMFGDLLAGGDWMSGKLLVIGAVQNMGKSSFLDSLIYEIISIPENNALAYMLTIDDPAEARFRRIMCNIVGDTTFTQNMIADPHFFADELGMQDIYEKREMAYAKLTELIASGALLIEDEREGRTVAHVERRVAQLRRDNPDKNIVVGIDNIYDCLDFDGMDGRERIGRVFKYAKRITRLHRCSVICTAEYRKGDASQPGTDDDLADCLLGNTRIINAATGIPLALEEITPGTLVHTVEETSFKVLPRRVLGKVYKGVWPCAKVTLTGGFHIEGTRNHPLLREDGTWTKIRDLQVGDFVAIPNSLQIEDGSTSLPLDLARFLGYMAGDGNYGSKNKYCSPRFTNSDPEIISDIEEIIERNFSNIEVHEWKHKNSLEIRFSRKKGTERQNQIRSFLEDIGVWGELAKDKTIPVSIFLSTKECKANYLAGLFSTDGSVDQEKGIIRFFTSSKDLAQGARELLYQLGVIGFLTESNSIFTLQIALEYVGDFYKQVPLVGKKARNLANFVSQEKCQLANGSLTKSLPPYFSKILKESFETNNLGCRIPTKNNKAGYVLTPKTRISRETLALIDQTLIPKTLSNYLEGDLLWLEVKSIESIGDHPVWDIEVEDTHNFVANGICCHNSRVAKYAPHLTGHIFSDANHKGEENAVLVHEHNGKLLPRVVMTFGKNKITDLKGKSNQIVFDFFPASSLFFGVPREVARADQTKRKEELAKKYKKDQPTDNEGQDDEE